MKRIDLEFVNVADGTQAEGTDGYNFADFFAEGTMDRALDALEDDAIEEANRMLAAAYKGPDTLGVGVKWTVFPLRN